MGEIVLTLPNDRAGAIALDTLRNRGEQRRDYAYLGDLSGRLAGSRAAELLPRLPASFHRVYVRDEAGESLMRDFLGYQRARPPPVSAASSSAEPTGASRFARLQADPKLRPDHSTYLSQLQVGKAHGKGNYGKAGHVAVIDTGSDGVSIDEFYDLLDPNTHHPGKANAVDNVGHGTAMATLIRAVAPDCTLTVIRTTDTTAIPLWHLLAAVAIAVLDAQAEILNLSLGLSNLTGTCTRCGASSRARGFALEYLLKSLRRLSAAWLPNGQPPVYVAATGNDGTGNGFFLPARYSDSLAVGAVNQSGQRSSFIYGTYLHPNYVMAPGGEAQYSTVTESPVSDNNGDYFGTSIAAAYASGVLALLRTDHPTADLLPLATQKVVAASPASVCGSGRLEYS